MNTANVLMMIGLGWSVICLILFGVRLFSRRALVLSVKQIAFGLLVFFLPMLIFMGLSLYFIQLSFAETFPNSPSTSSFLLVCFTPLLVLILLIPFGTWLFLRKYESVVFNVSSDQLIESLEKILVEHGFEYSEDETKIVVSNKGATIGFFEPQGYFGQALLKFSQKKSLPLDSAFLAVLRSQLKDIKLDKPPLYLYLVAMFASQLVFLFLDTTFDHPKLHLFDPNSPAVINAANFPQKLQVFFPFAFYVFLPFCSLIFGLRLLFRKSLVISGKWFYLMFLLLFGLIPLFLSSGLRFGFGWTDVFPLVIFIVILAVMREFSNLVFVFNSTCQSIFDGLEKSLTQHQITFSKKRSELILSESGARIQYAAGRYGSGAILIIKDFKDKMKLKSLLTDFRNHLRKDRYTGSLKIALLFIALGLLPILFILFLEGLAYVTFARYR